MPQALLSEQSSELVTSSGASNQVTDSYQKMENPLSNIDMSETKMQEISSETSMLATKKVEYQPAIPPHIPESNASDVSECSIATNITGTSHMDNVFLSQLMTKTEALTARQQVALWLTRTSMSDLSSMPSLKNIVHPPSMVNKEPPSRSSQSSHCSCYHHYGQEKQDKKRKHNGSNTYSNRPLSMAMSDCCFDATANPTQTNHCSNSFMSTDKSNIINTNKSGVPNNNAIRRNYSAKSLMGGFSFSFRGMGSDKTLKDIKQEKDTCEEKEALMPSPIRKCETVIALSSVNPCGTDEMVVDDSGAGSNVTTSTSIKRRQHQNFHNHPSSHTCSVSSVRIHCKHGNTSPCNTSTPRYSKRSTSLSLFKKLSPTSTFKERASDRYKQEL